MSTRLLARVNFLDFYSVKNAFLLIKNSVYDVFSFSHCTIETVVDVNLPGDHQCLAAIINY